MLFKISENLYNAILSYINKNYRPALEAEEYDYFQLCEAKISYKDAEHLQSCMPQRKLEDLVAELDETFSEKLIRLIDQKGLKDPDVYKKANIDRKLFSKIKNKKDYKPTKNTALAFAFALELSLDETLDLIGSAGYTLSHSSKFDIIIEYCLQEKIYNLVEINNVLFSFEQPTLTA